VLNECARRDEQIAVYAPPGPTEAADRLLQLSLSWLMRPRPILLTDAPDRDGADWFYARRPVEGTEAGRRLLMIYERWPTHPGHCLYHRRSNPKNGAAP